MICTYLRFIVHCKNLKKFLKIILIGLTIYLDIGVL